MTSGLPPLSILHVLAPAPFGGLETAVVSLAPALIAEGHRATVAMVLEPPVGRRHSLLEALATAGVPVEPIVLGARSYLAERRAVRELLVRHEVTVLHTHGYRPDVVDAPVARALGIPTVSTAHGYTRASGKNRIYEWLQRRALRRFDAVITVSEALRHELRRSGVEAGRLHWVRNAWRPRAAVLPRSEARDRLGLPADVPVVGWVGRMTHEKGPDVMVRVAAKVRGDVVFSMVGDGPLRPACESSARALGVDARMKWHGAVPEAGSLLGAFDALVLTSWTEGTPMVLLEAMSARVPIVTTAVGGIPAMLSPTEALLSPAGDIHHLAECIIEVLAEPSLARALATAAERRLLNDFAVEPWAREHVAIYRSVQEPR